MNGEILILSLVKGHSAGVIQTPNTCSYYDSLMRQYESKCLYWYSASKGVHILVQDMDTNHLWNSANLVLDTKRYRSGGMSTHERTAWYDILRKAIKDQEE